MIPRAASVFMSPAAEMLPRFPGTATMSTPRARSRRIRSRSAPTGTTIHVDAEGGHLAFRAA